MKLPLAPFCFALGLIVTVGCSQQPIEQSRKLTEDPELLHSAVRSVTEAMMESVTSPPVASRTYAYSSVAAFEAIRHQDPQSRSLAGRLNGLPPVPAPDRDSEYLLPLSGVNAYLTVAEKLVFAPEKVAAHREEMVKQLREQGVPNALIKRSMDYGAQVGQHVLAWAGSDNLKLARASTRLEIRHEPGLWVPTAPAYMDAVEPNWSKLRPFVLESGNQITTAPPTPYDTHEGSEFYRQAREVYETGKSLTPEQREIAGFWDCNPFAIEFQGHLMSAAKKISPGGHWMGITGTALRKSGADITRSAEAYARVSVAVADGFISSWDEKFRSIRVRPETVIQAKFDPAWQPLLQTPPFPEYTSGHSVISGAAAEVLTDFIGDNFAYTDSTNVPLGLPARSFTSFRQAAQEAALSRLYGGIHYRDAIDNGLVQGKAVGQAVVSRLGPRSPILAKR